MPPEQFIASLDSVASISDEYEEKLVARYGGETALDCLRSQARRPVGAHKAKIIEVSGIPLAV